MPSCMCVSYAPFRGAQTPLVPTTHISAEQIARIWRSSPRYPTACEPTRSKTASTRFPAAAKVGLKVIQGIWLGSNRLEEPGADSTAVRLTKEYPDVITSVVVGNEVLLRGRNDSTDLAATIRSVKAQVPFP